MVELYFQKSYLMTIYGINMSETVFSCSFFKFIPKGKHMIVSCILNIFLSSTAGNKIYTEDLSMETNIYIVQRNVCVSMVCMFM